MKISTRARFLLFAAATLGCALAGCELELRGVPVGNGLDVCAEHRVQWEVNTDTAFDVDVLLVIDDSEHMKEEQAKLADAIPHLLRAFTSGDYIGGPGLDCVPARSVHLAAVSTNMGAGDAFSAAPGCQGLGSDGLMVKETRALPGGNDAACEREGDSAYLEYRPDGDSELFHDQAECLASLGTEGCKVAQPLEAMWKALASSSDESFVSGRGHGDTEHRGFLRENSILVVILLTDKDDCSITRAGRALFDPSSSDPRFAYDGPDQELQGKTEGVDFRCAHEANQADSAELLSSFARYVDGLATLQSVTYRTVFAGFVGMPTEAHDLAGDVEDNAPDFEQVLNLQAMQVRPRVRQCTPEEQQNDPDMSCGKPSLSLPPAPACESEAGEAAPSRRIIRMAHELTQVIPRRNMVMRSICSSSYTSGVSLIASKVARYLDVDCLADEVRANPAACELYEIYPSGHSTCDGSRGRSPAHDRTASDFHYAEGTVCKVNRLQTLGGQPVPNPDPEPGVNGAEGWYYDNFSELSRDLCESKARVALTPGAQVEHGAITKLECIQRPMVKSAFPDENVGVSCDRSRPESASSFRECPSGEETTLVCEKRSATCQVRCTDSADCPEYWGCHAGFVTDLGEATSLCVPPSCPFSAD